MTKQKKQSGFTLVELLVAMGLLAAIFVASGFIFRAAIKAQQTAKAVLEITQKLQTITSQIDTDFGELNKDDGLIFMVWVAAPTPEYSGIGVIDEYDSFDRVMFFSNATYDTYHQYNGSILTGSPARITYMLASDADLGIVPPELYSAQGQQPADRILARSQHILIKDPALDPFPDFWNIPPLDWTANMTNRDYLIAHNETYEYDNAAIDDWNNAPLDEQEDMLTLATDIQFGNPARGGLVVTANDPDSLHMMLCQGVGSFSVQGWYDAQQRWVPELDPDGDGDLTDDSDYRLDGANVHSTYVIGLWYPDMFAVFGETSSIGIWQTDLTDNWRSYFGPINEPNFNSVPGLGRALKFTFTIYDSKGVFPEGKVFSHIVYLD